MQIFRRSNADNDPYRGINMGDKVKDGLTNFTGVVIARTEYLSGCNQVYVLPASEKANELKDGHWFDVERVVKLEDSVVEIAPSPRGSDIPSPQVTGKTL